jgi:hypothetical protein
LRRTKNPKVQIEREENSFGCTYRIYIGGMLMGATLSRDVAEKRVPHFLAIYAKAKRQDPSMMRQLGGTAARIRPDSAPWGRLARAGKRQANQQHN